MMAQKREFPRVYLLACNQLSRRMTEFIVDQPRCVGL